MKRINHLILSWFGAGLSPIAPGTAGSAAALPFAWIIASYWGVTGLIIAASGAFFLGWYVAEKTEAARKDPGWVVIDEVAGQWLTLALFPPDLLIYVAGFALFRVFDIFKPWPIRFLERRVPGGLGVMIDDIAAGVYAGLVLYGLVYLVGI